MKYFLNFVECEAAPSPCYYEFFKGRWDTDTCDFHNTDSMYIHDDFMFDLELDSLIISIGADYDAFGQTMIDEKQWREISSKAEEIGGELLVAVKEISPWIEENFQQHPVFTILGI